MTRLMTALLLTALGLLLAGCGGGAKTDTANTNTDTAGGAGAVVDETPAGTAAGGDGDTYIEGDAPADNATGGQGHTHQEGTVATEAETVAITGEQASYTAMTHDGWMVQITPTPAAPAVGTITWDVLVHAPGHTAVTPGQLLIEPEGQEVGTGKKLQLTVTQGDPGKATVIVPVEGPGNYEVEFHLHRSDGGDSHTKFTFTVA